MTTLPERGGRRASPRYSYDGETTPTRTPTPGRFWAAFLLKTFAVVLAFLAAAFVALAPARTVQALAHGRFPGRAAVGNYVKPQ